MEFITASYSEINFLPSARDDCVVPKSRATKVYSITISVDQVVRHYEEEKKAEADETTNAQQSEADGSRGAEGRCEVRDDMEREGQGLRKNGIDGG